MTQGQHERLAAAIARQPARAVSCPSCQAAIGRPCKRPSGHTIFGGGVHADRARAAEAARPLPPGLTITDLRPGGAS